MIFFFLGMLAGTILALAVWSIQDRGVCSVCSETRKVTVPDYPPVEQELD